MAINEHPEIGSLVMCDFDEGFREPEMVKKRPVIVLSPKISRRPRLCTIVALSTTDPYPVMSYHAKIDVNPPLPAGLKSNGLWIKGDMVNAVGFHRLDLIWTGKDHTGKRQYYLNTLSYDQIKLVKTCVLNALGLSALTKYL